MRLERASAVGERLGIRTGIDVRALAATALWICGELGRETPGRAARALAPPPK